MTKNSIWEISTKNLATFLKDKIELKPISALDKKMFKFFCDLLLFFCKSYMHNKNTCPILVHAADLPKVMCCFEATLASCFEATYYKTLLQPTY